MAAILQTYQSQSGLTLYAHIRDKAGLIWNGSSFEAFNVANWASYSITLVEQTSSSYYKVAMPGGIAKGLYTYGVYYGSPPAAGDQLYDSQTMDWDGSQQNYVGLVVDKLPSGDISGFDPTTENVNLNSNQTGVTIGTVNNLGAAAAASVKTQIDTAIGSDAIPELSGTPGATPTMKTALMFLFMALRNKRTSNAATINIYNGSGALIASAVQSDNGTVFTKENFS